MTTSLQIALVNRLLSKQPGQVKALLDQGADPNWKDGPSNSMSPMHVAAHQDFVEGLELLRHAGGDINLQDVSCKTPLMMAASFGRMDSLRWLLDQGANPSIYTVFKESALFLSVVNRHFACASMLLNLHPALRENELPTLPRRIQDGAINSDIVQWLVNEGLNPNEVVKHEWPWLIHFVDVHRAHDMEAIIDSLLALNVDVNVRGRDGATALHKAASHCVDTIFMKLLQAGADPDLPGRDGETARNLVSRIGTEELCQKFRAWEACRLAQKAVETEASRHAVKPL